MNDKIKRYNPDLHIGLTKKEIKEREKNNLINIDQTVPTKTIKEIILGNVFTLFNLLNFFLAFCVVLVGSFKNLLFMGGVFCNTLISIVQEIRTKKTIDKLSLLATTRATVIRGGKEEKIHIEEIVLDDIIKFKVGEQVCVDTLIKEGKCEVNEAFLTGEEEPVQKRPGDIILSGSFIVSGHIIGKVEHIGAENYTSQISKEAHYEKRVNSILMNSLNTIIKWVSIFVVPLGLLLFCRQLSIGNTIRDAVINTVAAVIGMIPEGLVLLTSTVLAVGILKLSKYKVLVQELYCIEMLARTDVLCLDKTGTLTEGKMEVVDLLSLNGKKIDNEEILSLFAKYSEDENATIKAVQTKYNKEVKKEVEEVIPFTSEKKYSALAIDSCYYILGAPEFLLEKNHPLLKKIEEYSKSFRILLLGKTKKKDGKISLEKAEPCALLLLQDVIRKKAKQTISYFIKQGVNIKVISGDNPKTVSGIAKRVGIPFYEKHIDMSFVKEEDINKIADEYTVFGRVAPSQKKALVKALKQKGHTVAMTGDGVNDVLALKEADCSIAMNSGSDAARNVSQIVLLDSNFDAMPNVVLEGRQIVNNIERSATLFLTKTMYASMLAVLFLFIHKSYPFEPIQLTLTSVVAIGIPSFILALETNKERIKGNFFSNVFSKSFPFSLVIVINVILIMIISSLLHLNKIETSTLCVIMNAIISFLLLFRVSMPLNYKKIILFLSMVGLFIFQILGFRSLFSLTKFQFRLFFIICILVMISFIILGRLVIWSKKRLEKRYK